MIDRDGIERPDNPNEHMVHNSIAPIEKEIDENYNFINKNIFFKMFSRMFRRAGIMILGPFIKHRYKLQIVGKENIKLVKHKGVIVTINHVHNFDHVLVGTRILNHRKCYFITLQDNINMPFVGFLLRALGGIPVPNKRSALPYFENCISTLLKKKKAIFISPEASLWPYYRDIRPFKKGAFRFAVKNDVPILPIVISFRRKLKKRSMFTGKEKFKYYFTVHVGKPLYYNKEINDKQATIDLMNETYEYYKITMAKFYEEEEKLEQEYKQALIDSNRKQARKLKHKLKKKGEMKDDSSSLEKNKSSVENKNAKQNLSTKTKNDNKVISKVANENIKDEKLENLDKLEK